MYSNNDVKNIVDSKVKEILKLKQEINKLKDGQFIEEEIEVSEDNKIEEYERRIDELMEQCNNYNEITNRYLEFVENFPIDIKVKREDLIINEDQMETDNVEIIDYDFKFEGENIKQSVVRLDLNDVKFKKEIKIDIENNTEDYVLYNNDDIPVNKIYIRSNVEQGLKGLDCEWIRTQIVLFKYKIDDETEDIVSNDLVEIENNIENCEIEQVRNMYTDYRNEDNYEEYYVHFYSQYTYF